MADRTGDINATDRDACQAFEDVVALLNYPMFVVTTRSEDEMSGCLVGFASQVSINPPALPGRTVQQESHLLGGLARGASGGSPPDP